MDIKNYKLISKICDSILSDGEAGLATIANPYFHVLSEHPIHLEKYSGLLNAICPNNSSDASASYPSLKVGTESGFVKRKLRFVCNAIKARPADLAKYEIKSADIVILSVLTNPDHLSSVDDFYFGRLQNYLIKRDASLLLVLMNQTGRPSGEMTPEANIHGECSSLLLPDTGPFSTETKNALFYLTERRRILKEARHCGEKFKKKLLEHSVAIDQMPLIISNLRYYSQVYEIMKKARPSIVISMYEGHAWERLGWHAARKAQTDMTLCVGYQHTILRKNVHAVKRALKTHPSFDPDLVLLLGDISHDELGKKLGRQGIKSTIYGTHRSLSQNAHKSIPNDCADILTLPEGLVDESEYLINFTVKCANMMPERKFILRFHPVLPFERLRQQFENIISAPGNIEISENSSIEEDFKRAGHLLYRGSSTVLYAVLSGLKPYYVKKPGDMNIDPVYFLNGEWRETVINASDFVEKAMREDSKGPEERLEKWRHAMSFCKKCARPVRQAAIDEMLLMAKLKR